jgi:hypothetical protein
MMRFKTIALALAVCLGIGAIAANFGQAAEGEGWTIGTTENQTTAGTLIPNGSHERVSCKKHGTSSLVFTSTLLGTSVKLTAEGVDCLEKAGSSNAATIDNTTSKGHGEGVLTFTGVKVVEPTNCSVAGGELTTAALTDQVIMAPTGGGVVWDHFFPENAATSFITIEFSGALCAIAEDSGTVKGGACGESAHTNGGGTGYEANKTGTLTKVQTVFGGTAEGGSECELKFGTAAAHLSGAVDLDLASSKPFGSD